MDIPRLLIANMQGEIIDCPELAWQGVAGPDFSLPENWIPLPPGSEIFTLPGRLPVGLDETTGEVTVLENYYDEPKIDLELWRDYYRRVLRLKRIMQTLLPSAYLPNLNLLNQEV